MEEKHKLKIKDKEVELTKSEAKRLYNELAILFGEQKLIKKVYYPKNYEIRNSNDCIPKYKTTKYGTNTGL